MSRKQNEKETRVQKKGANETHRHKSLSSQSLNHSISPHIQSQYISKRPRLQSLVKKQNDMKFRRTFITRTNNPPYSTVVIIISPLGPKKNLPPFPFQSPDPHPRSKSQFSVPQFSVPRFPNIRETSAPQTAPLPLPSFKNLAQSNDPSDSFPPPKQKREKKNLLSHSHFHVPVHLIGANAKYVNRPLVRFVPAEDKKSQL